MAHTLTIPRRTDRTNPSNNRRLLEYIDSNIIGKNLTFDTPWGSRKLIYADYTASGRGLKFITQYMMDNVLPYYANTHSENSMLAAQTTKLREGSRKLIKKYVNATEDDALIFTGSGSTAAINKLVDVLQLRDPIIQNKHVVFISIFDHHSNILPWQETGVEIVRINENQAGLMDEKLLTTELNRYRYQVGKRVICTFSAASNVTGIRAEVDKVSTLVHQYDGLIFWDYAAAAPYVKIDMNPSNTAYKDAIFISPHKFVGGPSTPGILIAKKKLFTNKIPSYVGGGTVNFVTGTQTEYVKDIETREEGGTPNILGAIQSGLVFQLKHAVGYDIIEERENILIDRFFNRFRNNPGILILGSTDVSRLAIFSFLIYVPRLRKYLHHNFICVLLSDLFGIQVRSGCSCAGPYVLELLHIDNPTAEIFTRFISENENVRIEGVPRIELMKPGFTRLNLTYFASDEEIDYILNAIEFIANEGWKFLPMYTYNPATAVWHCRDGLTNRRPFQFRNIEMINYKNGVMEETLAKEPEEIRNTNAPSFQFRTTSSDPIKQAQKIAELILDHVFHNFDSLKDPPLNIPKQYNKYIWFVLPKDIICRTIIDIGKQIRTPDIGGPIFGPN